MAKSNPSYKVGGNILPRRIVQLSGEFTVTQASAATQTLVGVSQEGTRGAPGTPFDDTYAGVDGDTAMRVHGPEEQCWVQAGGTVSGGNFLTADGDGKAVAASGGNKIVGIALENALADETFRMFVHLGSA